MLPIVSSALQRGTLENLRKSIKLYLEQKTFKENKDDRASWSCCQKKIWVLLQAGLVLLVVQNIWKKNLLKVRKKVILRWWWRLMMMFKKRCRIFFREQWYRGQIFFCLKPNSDWAIKMVIDFLLRKWWSYSKDVLQKYHDFSFGEPGLQKLDWFFYGRVVILCKNGTLQMWWSKGFFRFGFNAWKLQFIFALFGWSLLLEEFWNIFRPEL